MLIFCAIVFILLLGDLLWAWNLHRRLRQFPGRVLWQTLLALFTGVQVLGLILLIFGRQWGLPAEALTVKPVIAAVYIWNFLVLLPLCCLWFPWKIVTELLRRARPPAKRNRPERVSASKDSPAPVLTRRDFVATALCAAPALATLGATGLATEQWSQFRIRRMDVPIHDLPGALDGLTIAHVTDLHVGVFTRGAILDRIVAAANALQPDLVLLTGDLINHELRDLPVALEVVRRLQARHGIFLCEGNHDLFENAGEFRQRTLDAGLRLLVNSATIVSIRDVDVQFLGLRWGAGQGDPHSLSNRGDLAIAGSMKELLVQRDPDAFPILLAHHPHAFDYAEDIPLTLAGHTHGGQLMLTKKIGCGPAMFRYWSGLYVRDQRALVVSNGVGNWFPLRIDAPAEILHLTLRNADAVTA